MENQRQNDHVTLVRILTQLEEINDRESKRPQGYEHLDYAVHDLISEFIAAVNEELDYDPTPQYLYDHSGGEPTLTSGEIHSTAWAQHLELHS